MKKILILAFALTFSAFLSQAFAQNIAGTYNMNFVKANQVYTDRTPASQSFTGSTTFEVTQNGDEITVTLQNFGGKWSTHIMKGRTNPKVVRPDVPVGTVSYWYVSANASASRLAIACATASGLVSFAGKVRMLNVPRVVCRDRPQRSTSPNTTIPASRTLRRLRRFRFI